MIFSSIELGHEPRICTIISLYASSAKHMLKCLPVDRHKIKRSSAEERLAGVSVLPRLRNEFLQRYSQELLRSANAVHCVVPLCSKMVSCDICARRKPDNFTFFRVRQAC